MSSDFQQQIPGDPAGGIHYCFFQVFTHALLFHFDAIFMKFHGQLSFLGQPKMSATADAEFVSAYRARYTQKIPSNPRTYDGIWQIVAYAATHEVF